MQYRTLKRIWYRPYQMYIEPGESISLGHLNAKEIKNLVSRAIVRAVPEPIKNVVVVPPKKQVGTPRKRKKAVVPAKSQVKKKVSGKSTHVEKEPVKPVIKLNEEK